VNTTVVLAVIAGNVAMMGLVVKVLGDRIGDLATRMDRADARHDVFSAKLDGIAETLARFDERFKRLEDDP